MKRCDACGTTKGAMVSMGGAYLCRSCEVDVKNKVSELRENTNSRLFGENISVMKIAKEMLRQDAKSYQIRDIPDNLMKQFQAKCVLAGVSMRESFLNHMEETVKN